MDWIKEKEETDWTVNFRSLSRSEQVVGDQQRYKSERDLDSMEEGDMVKALEIVSLESVHCVYYNVLNVVQRNF